MFWFFLSLLFLLNLNPILASDPTVDRNIFGLHLTQLSDLPQAAPIINSSGGDWGYVTVVLRNDNLDFRSWQNFFDDCRQKHLIPIVRLTTTSDGPNWKRPDRSDIDNLTNFLNSLNWPMIPKYVIPFNEINHASEWGGGVDIPNFTDIFIYTAERLKSFDNYFFILSSPLDLASPKNDSQNLHPETVYRQIFNHNPKYFELMDALASHSYPNHGYVGTPKGTGIHSIRGYEWELNFIKNLGIQKTYPVFITETGWPHLEGSTKNFSYYKAKTSVDFFIEALSIWQSDPRVIAVTPFIFNYSQELFEHFSWLDSQGHLYPEYQSLLDLPKLQNHPRQITQYEIFKIHLPFFIFSNRENNGNLELKNTGQSIWGESNFCLESRSSDNILATQICTTPDLVPPGHIANLPFSFKVNSASSSSFLSWENTPRYSITPSNPDATIYHPQNNFWSDLKTWFKKFFKYN